MDPQRVKGLGFFGLSAAAYAYYPYVVMHIGQSMTTFLMTAGCVAGMYNWRNSQPVVNTIEFLTEGDHAGNLKFNVQDSLLKTRDIVVAVNNTHSLVSLGFDDMGEEDVDNDFI